MTENDTLEAEIRRMKGKPAEQQLAVDIEAQRDEKARDLALCEVGREIDDQRQCMEGSPFIALGDYIIVKLCPKQEAVGSIQLVEQSAAQRLYGLVLSIGPDVDHAGRLTLGDIIMFSGAGRQQLKLSDLDQEDYIVISAMMGFCKVDPGYVLEQGLKLPFIEKEAAPETAEK